MTTTFKEYYREHPALKNDIDFEMPCDKYLCVNNRNNQIRFTRRDVALCNDHYKELMINGKVIIDSVWRIRLDKNIGDTILIENIEMHDRKELNL